MENEKRKEASMKLTKKQKKFIKTVGNEEIALRLMEVFQHIKNMDYKKGYFLIKKLYKKYPENLWVIKTYAAQHGDYAQFLSNEIENKRKKESAAILRKALSRLNGVNSWLKTALRNEYYYHTRQYKKQYDLGVKSTDGKPTPHFSKAVGASEYSWELWSKGQVTRAKRYAEISVQNWEGLGKSYTKSNTFYYQALAISGQKVKALKLVTRDLQDPGISNQVKKWYKKYFKRIKYTE